MIIKKVIACKLDLGRLYQEVMGGDSKIPFHINVCITSWADGKFFSDLNRYTTINLQRANIYVQCRHL